MRRNLLRLPCVALALCAMTAAPVRAEDAPAAPAPATEASPAPTPAPAAEPATGAAGKGRPTEQGTSIWKDRSCNFFIVRTAWGYTLFEYLWGPRPNDGDIIEGLMDTFGTRNVINRTAEGKTMTVYSEVNSTSRRYVAGKIPTFCKHRKEFNPENP